MSEPFLGEIRLFACNYAPRGWALCEGQILPINANQALYALLGAAYGGNGVSTFALPDLRGRVPIASSSSYAVGAAIGEATHTLTVNEMPMHTHLAQASNTVPAANPSPENGVWGDATGQFTQTAANSTMSPQAIATAGGSQPHSNMQPFLALNFCIATQGIFPSRN